MTAIIRFSHAWFVNQIKAEQRGFNQLFTALFELSYNTYLHQHNEVNYNMRLAAFKYLKTLLNCTR